MYSKSEIIEIILNARNNQLKVEMLLDSSDLYNMHEKPKSDKINQGILMHFGDLIIPVFINRGKISIIGYDLNNYDDCGWYESEDMDLNSPEFAEPVSIIEKYIEKFTQLLYSKKDDVIKDGFSMSVAL